MRRRSLSSLTFSLTAVVATVSAVACGGSDDSTFGDPNGGSSSGSSGETVFGGSSGGTSGTSGGTSGAVGSVKPVSATDACASSNAGVDALPIYLVFMVDKSGSMGGQKKDGTLDPAVMAVRWNPAVAALKD